MGPRFEADRDRDRPFFGTGRGGDKVVFSRNDDGGGMVADLGLGAADTETVRSLRRSGPGRIRTSDQEVMSPLL